MKQKLYFLHVFMETEDWIGVSEQSVKLPGALSDPVLRFSLFSELLTFYCISLYLRNNS